jgi:hypothetical protein
MLISYPLLEDSVEIYKGLSGFYPGMVFQDRNRIKILRSNFTEQGAEVKGALAYGEVKILLSVIIVQVQLPKSITKNAEPLTERYLRVKVQVTGVEAEMEFMPQSFPELCEMIRSLVKHVLQGDPNPGSGCPFNKNAPDLNTVFNPEVLPQGEPPFVETRMEQDMLRNDLFRQIHDLGKTVFRDVENQGIQTTGRQIDKRRMEGDRSSLLPPLDHQGKRIVTERVKIRSRQVYLRQESQLVEEFQVRIEISEGGSSIKG